MGDFVVGHGVERAAGADEQIERTDDELIASLNAGDASAFDVLYFRYRDWVVNLAYRFTGDREISLDVLQETFLYLARKFPGFRLTAQMKTFLYPAVRNLSIGARKKTQRFQSSEEELQVIENTPAVEDAFRENEPLSAVMAQLSEEHREVLLLRFVDGLSLGEISDALTIPLGTVKSHVTRGRERLLRALEPNDGR